jgi:nicotinate-nucleotide pyrophosphorylase (carboxylating)
MDRRHENSIVTEFLRMLDRETIRRMVQRALDEDLPDITAEAIFEPADRGKAELVIKADGVIAGLEFAELTFATLDSSAILRAQVEDGAPVKKGDVIAEVSASVLALLSGERTALNFMQRASGIATMTRRYVDAVSGTKAKIYDTRKTIPGLRLFDKYAVAAGGGENHRAGLYDMYLVKNNHIDRAGSIKAAVEKIRAAKPRPEARGPRPKVMVEVRDMSELEQALALEPDFILLDNMSPDRMREAVAMAGGRIPLEASGGITLQNVRAVAETGVDRISIGALTHSVTALDISMRIKI